MASRRLDISSLLCDDAQPSFSPLDALVQAATEERKRLSAVDETQTRRHHIPPFSADTRAAPPNDHRVARSPAVSPQLSRYHTEDTQRIHQPQQPHYHQRTRPHHDNLVLQEPSHSPHYPQFQHHRQTSREIPHSSSLEADHRRREVERMQEQQRLQELQYQRLNQQEQERACRVQAQELDWRRREEDRLRVADFERHLRETERREAERQHEQQQQLQYQQQQYQRQLEELRREAERKRELERGLEERRLLERAQEAERLKDIDRQRGADEQRAPKRRSFSTQDSPVHRYVDNPIISPAAVATPHTSSLSHLVSHNSDSPQIRHSTSSISPDSSLASILPPAHDDQRPYKKRRYSLSPVRPIPDDQERVARERERMVVGELGYGRVDSPVSGPPAIPRRPGSGHNQARKVVAVADLLTDKEPPPPLQVARPDSRNAHRIISPTSRRSPPGSQIGRAKAARKSDEYNVSLREQHIAPPPPKELVHSPILAEPTKIKEEAKIKQEPKSNRPRRVSDEIRRTPTVDDARQKKPVKDVPQPAPPPKLLPGSSKTSRQDDAHEWFLHQYDEVPTPAPKSARPEPLHMPSPSPHPITTSTAIITTPLLRNTKSPPAMQQQQKALTPITVALEDLVSSPTSSRTATSMSVAVPKVEKREESDDMDLAFDLAVTELVDTLEDGDRKVVGNGMEVDVDSELLSLVDDRPPPPTHSENSAQGVSGSPTLTSPISTVHASNAAHPQFTPSVTAKQQQQVQRTVNDSHPTSKSIKTTPPVLTAPLPSANLVARQASARTTSDRDSMPPPATTTKGGTSKKDAERASSAVPPEPTSTASTAATTTTTKKKKETTSKAKSKSAANPTTTAKPRAKSNAKSKKAPATAAAAEGSSTTATGGATPATLKATKGAAGKKTARSASGSRSASVVPVGTPAGDADADKAEKQEEEAEEADNEDDKLYCLCKTKYDENRVMIACDRCDEWYHTQCVELQELDVDLVDQFICPFCIEKHSHLNLRTTYKQRCLWGLRHPDPDSPKACHKAARGAFSKYCSDECGVKYMQSRVDSWAKKGGKTDKLWESVKHAERREGVVIYAAELPSEMEVDGKQESDAEAKPAMKSKTVRSSKTKVERETERLNILLTSIMAMREEIQRGMEIVVCRERLLQLASERAEQVGQCGWDQRLCCDDDELADIGAGMLESYEESKLENNGKEEDGDGGMEVDGSDEQWWCPGKKVCDRHAGWQTIRYKDVCKEKEMKEEALLKLTTREREIRTRMEDMLDSHGANAKKSKDVDDSKPPLKSSTVKLVNGHSKSKASTIEKKSKKRKAPSA